MTDDTHDEDDLTLPEHFTDEARDLVEGFLDDLDDDAEVDALSWGALIQAGELISTADRLDEVARAADYMTTGSQGQEVLHPAIAEARQARSTAASTLARLRPKNPGGESKFSGGAGGTAAKAAAARWSKARDGARSRKGR